MTVPTKVLKDFQDAVLKEDSSSAELLLTELKNVMIDLDSLPPLGIETANAIAERKFAREVLELSVLLAVNMGDKEAFQCKAILHRLYQSKESALMNTILGLNLLYLLVDNRLADFHCELELLTEQQQQLPEITFCTQLDKHLVVGSYDEVLAATAHPPVKYYSFFLKSLLETVRLNIGECIAAAYSTLSVAAATKMLMFTQPKETLEFISDYFTEWSVFGDTINLTMAKHVPRSEGIPSMKLITQTLSYATELERIV